MFDRKGEANEFVGESREDAAAAAARFYGVEASEVEIAEPGMGEVHGLGGRTVVVAYVKGRGPGTNSSGGDRGGDEERGRGRGRGRDRDRDRDRDRGERKSRGDEEERGRGRGRGRSDGGDRKDSSRERVSAEEAEPSKPKSDSKGTAKGELGELGEFLLGAVERLKLGSFEICEVSEDDFLVYQIAGEACAELGSGDGRAVDALQLLVNQVAKRAMEEPPRVVVEVEGSDDRRSDALVRLAKRAADRASETGRAVALDPMNSRDRRIIHLELKERDEIATMSIGSTRYRQVVVVPEGADEYEEAQESAKSSG